MYTQLFSSLVSLCYLKNGSVTVIVMIFWLAILLDSVYQLD